MTNRQFTINYNSFFIALVFLLLSCNCFSQKYSSSNPTAIKYYERATQCLDVKQIDKALEFIQSALDKDSSFVNAWLLRAEIYEDQKKDSLAIANYKKAISINPDFFAPAYFSLGSVEFHSGKYEEAKADLLKFIAMPKASKDLVMRANVLIPSCDFAANAVKHPVPFEPINMGDSINSADEEYFPCITLDEKTFIFTRRKSIIDRLGRKTQREYLYSSQFEKGHWTKATQRNDLAVEGNIGSPKLSADGNYLFFVGCEEAWGYAEGLDQGYGSCDIFISKRDGKKWGQPRNLGPVINTKTWESQPSFSSDGRTLYFVRGIRKPDGSKQHDIYVSFIDDSSNWSEPIPLPDNINTPLDETSVFIHPDDQTLYFSSNGHPGMGGFDIFMSKRKTDGSWGDPVNLGYPINTSADDNSLLASPSGKIAFFASNRADSRGGLDLYQFDLPDSLQPQKVTYMKGIVYDAETKKPLAATFELIDLATAKPVVRSSSNEGNGEFLVCLPSGKSYALNVSKDGYMFYSDNFELKSSASVKEPFLKDVPLKPIKAGESIVLKNIFYETDKFDLKDESHAELSKMIAFMKKNQKVKVEVGGHTDNTGSKIHNQSLSENRAKAVVDYLISNGIDKSRVSFKGYADTKPLATNATEAGKAQNRRTEFTIISTE